MASSKATVWWRLEARRFADELRAANERIKELELKLKHYSAHYSEGGSGEYVNNEEAMNRFEGKT